MNLSKQTIIVAVVALTIIGFLLWKLNQSKAEQDEVAADDAIKKNDADPATGNNAERDGLEVMADAELHEKIATDPEFAMSLGPAIKSIDEELAKGSNDVSKKSFVSKVKAALRQRGYEYDNGQIIKIRN